MSSNHAGGITTRTAEATMLPNRMNTLASIAALSEISTAPQQEHGVNALGRTPIVNSNPADDRQDGVDKIIC
jgi:hypothetical protein